MANTFDRIAGPANAASGTSTMFTGTVAHVYVIKNIRYVNNTAAAITVKVGIGGVTDALLIIPAISVPAGGLLNHDCFVILEGTETLQISASATGGTYTVSAVDVG